VVISEWELSQKTLCVRYREVLLEALTQSESRAESETELELTPLSVLNVVT